MRIDYVVVSVTMPKKLARAARREAKRRYGHRSFSHYVRHVIERDFVKSAELDAALKISCKK